MATLPLIAAGCYSLLWGLFFLIEGLRGHTLGGYVPLQLILAALLCLSGAALAFVFVVFFGTRGWYLLRRDWPAVPKITLNPAAMQLIMKMSWIPPVAGILATLPPYVVLWGWPERVHPLALGLMLLACFPSFIVHELLHAVGFWIVGRVPCNQLRFGVALRQGALYAYTHRDMQVWGYQVGVALPMLMLGVVPLYGGLVLHQPVVMGYGLLMLLAAAGDLYFLWRTLPFPRNASFNTCAAEDEILSSFALVEQA